MIDTEQLRSLSWALSNGHLDRLYYARAAGLLREAADEIDQLRADAVVLLASNAALRARIEKARARHVDSGERVQHWCSVFGGGMEPNHEPDGPNSCAECGVETPYPCPTIEDLT